MFDFLGFYSTSFYQYWSIPVLPWTLTKVLFSMLNMLPRISHSRSAKQLTILSCHTNTTIFQVISSTKIGSTQNLDLLCMQTRLHIHQLTIEPVLSSLMIDKDARLSVNEDCYQIQNKSKVNIPIGACCISITFQVNLLS